MSPDEVEQAASALEQAAEELDRSASSLSSQLGAFSWFGQVAVVFVDRWHSRHRPAMTSSARALREAAEQLRAEARVQRETSAASTLFAPLSPLELMRRRMEALAAEAARRKALADALAATLIAMRTATPQEQAAWWASLSPEQQQALLAFSPAALLALPGLPADVLAQARDNYISSIADEISTGSTSVHGELEVSIRVLKVGGSFDVEVTSFRDGHVEVDLRAAVRAGADAELVAAMAEAGVSGVFSFDSQAEADRFLADLEREAVPSAGEILRYQTAAPAASLVAYLVSQRDHLTSVALSVDTTGTVKADTPGTAASIEGGQGIEASVDTTTGDVTLTARSHVTAAASATVMGVSGTAEVSAALTLDGTTPKTLTFTQSFENTALTGVLTPVVEAAGGVVTAGTVEVQFDLTDPSVRAVASEALAAVQRGDVGAAMALLDDARDAARIIVTTEVGSTAVGGFDVKVADGKVEYEQSTVTSTYVKPPFGAFLEV